MTILAGDPNCGTPGLVPDAHFFAANVYRADEGGQPVADTLSLLRAIDWLAASKVEVVNMSLSGPDDKLLQDAIAETSRRGVVFQPVTVGLGRQRAIRRRTPTLWR